MLLVAAVAAGVRKLTCGAYLRAKQRPEILAAAAYWPTQILVTSVCREPSDEQMKQVEDHLLDSIARHYARTGRYPHQLHRHSPEIVAALSTAGLEHHPM